MKPVPYRFGHLLDRTKMFSTVFHTQALRSHLRFTDQRALILFIYLINTISDTSPDNRQHEDTAIGSPHEPETKARPVTTDLSTKWLQPGKTERSCCGQTLPSPPRRRAFRTTCEVSAAYRHLCKGASTTESKKCLIKCMCLCSF